MGHQRKTMSSETEDGLHAVLSDANLTQLVITFLDSASTTARFSAASPFCRRRILACIACDEVDQLGARDESHSHQLLRWIRRNASSMLRARQEHPWSTNARHCKSSTAHNLGRAAHVCAEKGDAEFLTLLHASAPHTLMLRTSEQGDSVAHIAARRGHCVFIRALHAMGYTGLLQCTNDEGWTIAHCALAGAHDAVRCPLFTGPRKVPECIDGQVLQAMVTLGYGFMFDTRLAQCDILGRKPEAAKTEAERASSQMHKLIGATVQKLKLTEGRYKSGRLTGANSTVQSNRRILKTRLRAALRTVCAGQHWLPQSLRPELTVGSVSGQQ